MSIIPRLSLNDGTSMPQIGLGLWQVSEDSVVDVVSAGLAAGYRGFDTATIYGNERGVGEAIAESGIPRHELHITTKLWNTEHGFDSALRAFDLSAKELGLDYVDLYLIHWAAPGRNAYVETWRALGRLRQEGRVRSIGVSNFAIAHIERLIAETGVTPAVHQLELHPYLPQSELRAFNGERGIATEAWAPLACGLVLDAPAVRAVAARRGRTPAQIVIRWHLHLGNIVIPKSVHPDRMSANLDVFDFELTDEDLADLASTDEGRRLGPRPEEFDG